MLNKKFSIATIMLLLAFGQVLVGCTSAPDAAQVAAQTDPQGRPTRHNERVYTWAENTRIPNKNYTVVGIIILREVDPVTLSTDLMERAAAMGAHDIKNVRVDFERMGGRRRIVAASAVAIRYTDETIIFP